MSVAVNQASSGQVVNGAVSSQNDGMMSKPLGSGSGDDDGDPPDECSSKLPRRLTSADYSVMFIIVQHTEMVF